MSNELLTEAGIDKTTRTMSGTQRHLADIFLDHRGNISDKWEQYLAIYELELQRFVASFRPVQLLEIGVQNGGSLQIWSQYMPPGSSIVGIDVNPECGELALGDNVRVEIGDAGDATVLDEILGGRRFDIIIDDGSHRSEDVIATFQACFPRLKPGGIYVIEDLHCSYHTSFNGGAQKRDTAIEWLKLLVDSLNADHIQEASAEMQPEEIRAVFEFSRDLARVTFYDSMAVIEKLLKPKAGRYRRVISGQSGTIVDPSAIVSQLPSCSLGHLLLSESMASAFAPVLLHNLATARNEASKFHEAHVLASAELASLREQLASCQENLASCQENLAFCEAREQRRLVPWWRRGFSKKAKPHDPQ